MPRPRLELPRLGPIQTLTLVALAGAMPALAAKNSPTVDVDTSAANPVARVLFVQAFKQAIHGQLAPNGPLARELKGYPLAPYLTAARLHYRLAHHPGPATDQRVEQFITTYRHWPAAAQLRQRWLASLVKRGRWHTLLTRVGPNPRGTSLRCGVVHARIERGQKPKKSALALWDVGHSQPKTCNPVFAWLKKKGQLTPEVIEKRARLVLIAGHTGLARYLKRQLADDSKRSQQLTRWINVAEHPKRLDQTHQMPHALALALFKRFALSDLDSAAAALPDIVHRLGIGQSRRYKMRRWVALLYAENHKAAALKWFAKISDNRLAGDPHAIGWAVRSAIYQNRWHQALKWLNTMPQSDANQPKWRYWRARALAQLGHRSHARSIYTRLAHQRAYYGFLAADRIHKAYHYNYSPLPDNSASRTTLARRPGIIRARLLYRAGLEHRATREWRQALVGADNTTLAQAAALAYGWGWYSRAITTLARANYWDDLRIRYPIPHKKIVQSAARANGLSSALILAVMRTESLFQATVRSSAGALGLMQVKPQTARYVAHHLSNHRLSAGPLTNPAINIRIGSRLLAYLLHQRWGNNPALAVAGYNAGSGKVADWLPQTTRAADIWIANIPYTETRRYVERILKHTVVFKHRLDQKPKRLLKRLGQIEPAYPGQTVSR